MANILVTGANGQLGNELRTIAPEFPQHNFTFVTREVFPLDDINVMLKYLSGNQFDFLINCAAYTAVDKAETEKDLAYTINATAVGEMAKWCNQNNCRFIHFSTDYVFNGNATEPMLPDDVTDPVNYYGYTKLEGEKLANKNNRESLIIRTSWVYSSFGKNFVKTMMRLMAEKESIGVVADQVGSPTYAADLAQVVIKIVEAENFVPGIYHYSNKGVISWHQFAMAIRNLTGSNCIVNSIATSDFPTPAKRPAYSAMDTSKISHTYQLEIPDWENSLKKCLEALRT